MERVMKKLNSELGQQLVRLVIVHVIIQADSRQIQVKSESLMHVWYK